MNKKIAIIDYQLGNLFSVQQACIYLGYNAKITSNPLDIVSADYVILPGVGAFEDAMSNMNKLDLIVPTLDYIASGKPFMGVCLGLQLLFTESEEFGISKGLNIVEGTVKRFKSKDSTGNLLKIPQIAWNEIHEPALNTWENTPLQMCSQGDYMYFVHSYYVKPELKSVILSTTNYGGYDYCSSIIKNNVFACQFHPEKSSKQGLIIYEKFFK